MMSKHKAYHSGARPQGELSKSERKNNLGRISERYLEFREVDHTLTELAVHLSARCVFE